MSDLDAVSILRGLDTCRIANAIEECGCRLRNQGFSAAGLTGFVAGAQTLIGFAATARIRCTAPPMPGHAYVEHTAWWDHVLAVPAPRVMVIQDDDPNRPGAGALVGEVHASILQGLGCAGVVTNGSVRDVDRIAALPLPFALYARGLSPSHAYAHLVETGGTVELPGLPIRPGALIAVDRHGIVEVPAELAPRIRAVALRQMQEEARLISLCSLPGGIDIPSLRRLLDAEVAQRPGSSVWKRP